MCVISVRTVWYRKNTMLRGGGAARKKEQRKRKRKEGNRGEKEITLDGGEANTRKERAGDVEAG